MRAETLRRHFMKVYSKCSRSEIENLVSAMLSGKFWRVRSGANDAYYVIALTRAKYPYKDGFRAKLTAPVPVVISARAAQFCRRGRILLIKRRNNDFISETVIDWPSFLKIMKLDENLVYKWLVKEPNPPVFLNRRRLKAFLHNIKVMESNSS